MNQVTYIAAGVVLTGDAATQGFNDVLLPAVGLLFVVLLVLETIKPYRRFGARIAKSSIITNTSAFLFNNIILTVLSASSLFFIAQQFAGYGLLSGMENGVLKWLLCFVLFDLAIYLYHYASHHSNFLWRFHKIHHSDKSLNVTTGFRFHVFDLFIEIIYKCFFVITLGVEAYVVLSLEVIRLFFILFHHANISFKYDHLLSYVIITPELHRVHHSTKRSEHDSNYGIALSIWDLMFGTRKELVPEKIGLDLVDAENFVQLFCLAFITEKHISKILSMLPKGRR